MISARVNYFLLRILLKNVVGKITCQHTTNQQNWYQNQVKFCRKLHCFPPSETITVLFVYSHCDKDCRVLVNPIRLNSAVLIPVSGQVGQNRKLIRTLLPGTELIDDFINSFSAEYNTGFICEPGNTDERLVIDL